MMLPNSSLWQRTSSSHCLIAVHTIAGTPNDDDDDGNDDDGNDDDGNDDGDGDDRTCYNCLWPESII